MREINYDKVLENLNTLINTLEFDAMRSPGKMKQNAMELQASYNLKDRYEAMLKPVKQTPKKKEG